MTAGRPRKYHRPETISGRIPGTKKDIIDILGISPTQIINTGVNITLENLMHRGRVSQDVLVLYISSLRQEIAEIEEKIHRAESVLQTFAEKARKDAEQITVFDLETNEKVKIKRSDYVKERHAMIAECDHK